MFKSYSDNCGFTTCYGCKWGAMKWCCQTKKPRKIIRKRQRKIFSFLKRTALIHPLCWYITVLLTIFRGSKTYLFVLLSKLVFTWLLVYDLRYSDYLYCNDGKKRWGWRWIEEKCTRKKKAFSAFFTMGLFSSSSFFDGNPDLFWVKNAHSYKGPQYDSSIPRSRLKFSLNPVIPMVDTGQSRSRSYNFVSAHFLNLEGPFQSVMIFLTSIDPLKSMVTIRHKCFLLFSCFLFSL